MKDYWSKQKVLQEESEEKDASVYEWESHSWSPAMMMESGEEKNGSGD
jgi:hypothetical protein